MVTEQTRCGNRARGGGGVLQCTLDPDHDGIHSSGDWYWNPDDTDATQGEPAELVTLECARCGAVPLTDDWGEITGWADASDEQCEHLLATT